ncbi:MAG: ABC-type multidrug transport system ATPase subunit [Flavobacteriales bacterium]|jgi:ABC-type multidrug transport system ATPase subunit
MSIVLEIKNLTKKFGSFTAVNNLSLTIEKGNVFGILGPNGSGKTTTLGMVLDVLNPSEGSYSWYGDSQGTNNRKKIGSILEHPIFYPELSGYKNLEITSLIKGVDKSRIEEVLTRVDLIQRKYSPFSSYSLGMKQRLALAAALLSNPEVLVLDEPTNGLDPEGIRQMRELIISIAKEGKTIIISSHILDEIQKMCSHYAILKHGKLLKQGAIGDILSSKNQFLLDSNNNEELKSKINQHPSFSTLEDNEGKLKITFNDKVKGSDINEFMHSQGILLSELTELKTSLEDEFLEIIKK